jgi:hypothetical protein
MALNRIAIFAAGVALGAAGMALVKQGKTDDLLKNAVQTGHDLSEKFMGTVETIREDVEDYLAEAKYRHEQKVQQSAEESFESDASPEPVAAMPAKAAPKKPAPKKAAPKKAAPKKGATGKSAAKKSAKPADDESTD